jgi:hypothetical protein
VRGDDCGYCGEADSPAIHCSIERLAGEFEVRSVAFRYIMKNDRSLAVAAQRGTDTKESDR